MKLHIKCILIVSISFLSPSPTLCQLEIPSSFNPVGQGARALGMGGAFIAIADDATAASWNPAGLIQLERPEVSIVGSYFHRTEDLDFGTNPESSGNQTVDETRVNYLSATYPFSLMNRNMVISINYQNLYDLSRNWNFPLIVSSDPDNTLLFNNVDYKQDGSLSAWSLAYSFQITPALSIGATVNIWEDGIEDNNWQQKSKLKTEGNVLGNPIKSESTLVRDYDLNGLNFNLGLLWNITNHLTLGAVLKSPFTADVDLNSKFNSRVYISENVIETSSSSSDDLDLEFPISYGLGMAYRVSDIFTVSLDVYRTHWDDFEFEDSQGNKFSAVTGKPSGESDIDPTNQIRMGAEYLLVRDKFVIPMRGGVFYDPAPAEDNPDDFFGFSLGTGIGVTRFAFDIAYQFRWGNDVGEYLLEDLDFSQDVREHSVFSSLILYF